MIFPKLTYIAKKKNEAGGKKERPQVTKANLPNFTDAEGKC